MRRVFLFALSASWVVSAPVLPQWKATYNMQLSTIVQPCNNTGVGTFKFSCNCASIRVKEGRFHASRFDNVRKLCISKMCCFISGNVEYILAVNN